MDLHQGSNEFNPLRTKPITAAMKQDQKHIEGSVYDPSTGTTVVSLARRSCFARVGAVAVFIGDQCFERRVRADDVLTYGEVSNNHEDTGGGPSTAELLFRWILRFQLRVARVASLCVLVAIVFL